MTNLTTSVSYHFLFLIPRADNMTAATGGAAGPVINDNPELQSYYQSLESRIGYRLVLGGTRHFGYWYVCLLCLVSPGGGGEEGQGCCLVRAPMG